MASHVSRVRSDRSEAINDEWQTLPLRSYSCHFGRDLHRRTSVHFYASARLAIVSNGRQSIPERAVVPSQRSFHEILRKLLGQQDVLAGAWKEIGDDRGMTRS